MPVPALSWTPRRTAAPDHQNLVLASALPRRQR